MDEFTFDLYFDENLPFFKGHFPGQPIVPGAILLGSIVREINNHTDLSLTAASKIRFMQPVKPKQKIAINCTPKFGDNGQPQSIQFICASDGVPVAKGNVLIER